MSKERKFTPPIEFPAEYETMEGERVVLLDRYWVNVYAHGSRLGDTFGVMATSRGEVDGLALGGRVAVLRIDWMSDGTRRYTEEDV